MKNALILHGTSSSSQGNWFPWLKKELEKNGWKVWVPDLPESDKPSIERYNDFIFANNDWKFDNDSVIIGHSSGSVAILGILQNLPDDVTISKAILVGSFKNDLGWDNLKELFSEPLDFEKIKKHCNKFVFIHSNNDPHCPLEHAEYLSKQLDGKLIVLKNQGHFNLEQSPKYKQFPFLLSLLEQANS